MAELGQSEIRAMTQACVAAGGLNMAQGVCDTPVPPVVLKSAAEAMVQGRNSYSRFDGLPELRQALAVKLDRDNGIRADPETDITVSAGATGAFHSACMALLNPGNEVIVFQPYYQYHISALLAVEARPVIVPTTGPDWTFDAEAVERAIRSEEHTSELQSLAYLVCRLLLEKKNNINDCVYTLVSNNFIKRYIVISY